MVYPEDFLLAMTRLGRSEAGFTKDPKDSGNWTGGRCGVGVLRGTKFGIAANTYPSLDIEHLTEEDARAIYWRDWWLKVGADELPFAISYQVWQFAVNAGMETAKRALQRAVGLADDGQIGPVTLAKIKAMKVTGVLFRLAAQEARFYTGLSPQKWEAFGRGWMNRLASQMELMAVDT